MESRHYKLFQCVAVNLSLLTQATQPIVLKRGVMGPIAFSAWAGKEARYEIKMYFRDKKKGA